MSCVEQRRWDSSRHGESFAPSPQTAFPALRAAKNLRMRAAMSAGAEARADQGEVWQHVDERLEAVGAGSETAALHDAYEARRDDVAELQAGVRRRDGQLGCLVAISGQWVVLDHVSRGDVFAALHAPLVAGYALDALGRAVRSAPTRAEAARLVGEVCSAPARVRRGTGLGHAVAFDALPAAGTGLVHDGELIQLSAYAGAPGRAARIRRPSRRR